MSMIGCTESHTGGIINCMNICVGEFVECIKYLLWYPHHGNVLCLWSVVNYIQRDIIEISIPVIPGSHQQAISMVNS